MTSNRIEAVPARFTIELDDPTDRPLAQPVVERAAIRHQGTVYLTAPAEAAIDVLGHMMYGASGEPIEHELFDAVDSGRSWLQVALAPRQFANNPVCTLADMLVSSGPIEAVILDRRQTFGAGGTISDRHVRGRTTGRLIVGR